jgi:nicotinate-nucleotide adenylyltransferase
MSLQRAAIFGGTFDPVHKGHLEAARRVQHLFTIDEMIFVPACVPPHKRNANITSAFHRFAMLALAIQADAQFRISTVELDNPDRPYAVDTVARLQAELGSNWRLFFVMGADSWGELTSWHQWQRLLTICSPIVVTRPGYNLGVSDAARATEICDVRGMHAGEISAAVESSIEPRTFFTNAAMIDVSATAIREAARASEREKLRTIIPGIVADYIEKHGLYRD